MPGLFGLIASVGYCFWVAKGRRRSVVQGVLHGFFLGMLCFCVLPPAMERPYFFSTAACSVCGMMAGTWLEKKLGKNFPLLAALLFSGLTLLWLWNQGLPFPLFTAFLGGTGLYAACCGIWPEDAAGEVVLRLATGGGVGFLFSAIIFSLTGIF